ncbi:hypothetical protein J2S74_004589 [Evansella vedderi]|uniref:Uncharacterized protein n=1 Tax=Evansella vedderi TaxID=38282 RepID=A0ABU0A0Y7_9BACI|nr:hypothetical protein [Evansella vedderi]MDQ0257143.1 hypothetical protein [Evansella vedderi]
MGNGEIKAICHQRGISKLVDNGWLDERKNPAIGWDHTKQYRVNLIKLQRDLLEKGYVLQDYKINLQDFMPPT